MPGQSNILSEDDYIGVLNAIDELQNIVSHLLAGTVFERDRFHIRMVAILRRLAQLVEIACSSSVYLLYVGDVALNLDENTPVPCAGIPGPDLLDRLGADIVETCTQQLSQFYLLHLYRKAAGVHRFALPALQDEPIPARIPRLPKELEVYASQHDLLLLSTLVSNCDEYEQLVPPRGNNGYWGKLEANPELASNHVSVGLLELSDRQIVTAKFQDAFWDMMHPIHEDWSVSRFVAVIKLNPLMDKESGMLYGGKSGVRLFVLACIRVFCAVFRAETLKEPQLSLPRAVSPSAVLDYLLTAVILLNNGVTNSIRLLKVARADPGNPVFNLQDLSDETSAHRIEAVGIDARREPPGPPSPQQHDTPQIAQNEPPFLAYVKQAGKLMAAAHTSAQGSSILKARAAANSALSAPASRAASVAGPSAPQSRVGTKSLPSAPASVTVSEASSVQEDQDNGDEVVVLEPDDITAGGGEDDAISVPESEDPPVEEQETQKPATRGSKRIARSSDPPQDVDKTGPGTASKQHDGKGKSTSMGPPISKRPRKGSTASDAIDLELESDDARAAAAADLNSSKVLPPAHDDFWDDIRRMATSVDPLLNTSTPNAGPSRQRATIEAAPQEPNRSIQTAIRGRGRGKSAPPEKTQTAGRGGKKAGAGKGGAGKAGSRAKSAESKKSGKK